MSTTLYSLARSSHGGRFYIDVGVGVSHEVLVALLGGEGVDRLVANAWADEAARSVGVRDGLELASRGAVHEHLDVGPRKSSFRIVALTAWAPYASEAH